MGDQRHFPPIFDTVLKRFAVRGPIVCTRADLMEALAFAGKVKVTSHYLWLRLEEINDVFGRMRKGEIEGRLALELGRWRRHTQSARTK